MIRIKKPNTAPRILRNRGVTQTDADKAAYDGAPQDYRSGNKTFEFERKIYAAKSVKNALLKAQYDKWTFPDGHSILVLAEGRLLNLGCATGHPSFVMSNSFTNQTLAQIEIAANKDKYGNKVYVLPKILDEKVARLHLDKLGVKLTTLTQAQADYISVPVEGPYKPEYYRY